MTDVGGPNMGSATLGQVVLDGIRTKAEQAMETKPASCALPWPLHQLLTQAPALMSFSGK